MLTRANILDPIQKKLDSHIFVDNRVRASVSKFVKDTVYDVLKDHFGFDCSKLVHLYLTGSLTTFQYHATSDFDINLFVDYDKWPGKPDPDDLKKQLLRLIFTKIDHKLVPGTDHPLQTFILPKGIEPRDQFDVGMRSAWSFDKKDWVVKPEKDRVINVLQDLSPIYQKAMRTAEKMRVLLDQDPEQAIKLYHKLHKKRQREQQLYGDFAEGNIIYKFLDSEGLFTKLRELGVKIAQIHLASWQDVEQKAKRYIEEGRFSNVTNNGDFFSAEVNGETGVWEPQIWKDDPFSRSISRWACTCPWGQNSWGRTRSWIKYEGRPCAHILGLHWLTQGTPKDYKESLESLIPNVQFGEAPTTEPLTPPDEYPLQNGDMVVVKPQMTFDAWDPHDPDDVVTITQNTVGQVLEQISENLVRVVFPNPTGWYHENKMYEAIENPNKFYVSDTARDPFVKRPPGWQPNAKIASGNVYYHISDKRNRESILQNGLIPGYEPYTQSVRQRQLTWLFDSPEEAQAHLPKSWGGSQGNNDLWQVEWDGLVEPDPDAYDHYNQRSFVVSEAIPPENLTLLTNETTAKIANDDIWEDFDAATPEQKLTELEAKGYGRESTARSIRFELIWRSMGEIT